MGNKVPQPTPTIRPEVLADLKQATAFSEKEIKQWYKDFTKDFPSESLTVDQFKDVYIKNFPNGDAAKFAEHVFRTFDKDNDYHLNFREFMVALSATAKGESRDRLRWAFRMYDVDNNGFITKDECIEIVTAVYRMVGEDLPAEASTMSPETHVSKMLSIVDTNKDGRVTQREFLDAAYADPLLMKMFLEPATPSDPHDHSHFTQLV